MIKIRTASISLASLFLAVLCVLFLAGVLPLYILVVYLSLSLVTFVSYWLDKRAAVKNARRTPENILHSLALAGGWPGALIAQQTLRHKTLKVPFRYVLWVTVVVNAGMLIWLLLRFNS